MTRTTDNTQTAAPQASAPAGPAGLDVRGDFPILSRRIHDRPLAYLDNAASTQKPRAVIDAITRFYEQHNANVHRGLHTLSAEATAAYERARKAVQRFINAGDASEIVFTRGTTEAINLVAHCFGETHLREGGRIILSELEHHSNIVPWQLLCKRTGAELRIVPIDDRGDLDLDAYAKLLSDRTRIVALTHVSNALGTVNDVRRIIDLAHERGVPVLLDGAQAMAHMAVDVRALGCDFYAFSGHKMLGPTGIGVLYGKADRLADMPPYQGGGEMIRTVTFEETTYADPPARFEAGTPPIAGAIGLGAAIDYIASVGYDRITAHERGVLDYAVQRLAEVPRLRIVGEPRRRAGVISMVIDGVHPHDVATILDRAGVAVRAGHHCAQPLMDRLGVTATTRASFALYNTREDVDALVAALNTVLEVFR